MDIAIDIAAVASAIVTLASVVTALTPSKSDDAALDAILRVLNATALNVAKNRNADDNR